jgi:hypothetical protein
MPPRSNQRRLSLDRIQVLQSISTPLGFFVLVVLVVEVVFGIIAGLQQGPDRTYLIVGMIFLMFFVVAIVGVLAYLGKGLGQNDFSGRLSLLVLPPEDMPELDVAAIDWNDAECFILSDKMKEPITLVPSRVGPSFRVEIPRQIIRKLELAHPVELQLKDKRGYRWRVKRFFVLENLVHLSCLDDREKVVRDYREAFGE